MDIFRERTDSEKNTFYGGYRDIRNWRKDDAWTQILAKIAEAEQKWVHEKKVPYASKLAMDDCKKKLDELERNIKKSISLGETNVNFDLGINFDSYAGENLFEFVGEKEIIEDKLIDGIRQSVKVGIYRDYRCKVTGQGRSIQILDYERERLKKQDGSQNKIQEKKN